MARILPVALLGLLLVGSMQLASAASDAEEQAYNPFYMSDKEKAYIIKKFAGKELTDYAKRTKTSLYVSNSLGSTYRGTPWVEIIYKNGTTTSEGTYFDVWNSCIVEDQFNTNQDNYLNYSSDPPDRYNFNKRFVVDMDIIAYYTQAQIKDVPLYKDFPFTSDPKLKVRYQYAAPTYAVTTGSTAGQKYTESNVFRWNTWVFYPRSTIYLLIKRVSSKDIKIYVMQAMASNVNQQLLEGDLVLNPVPSTTTTNPLKPSIVPPSGWTYAYVTLDRFLAVPARGKATVISDNLDNAYMLIPKDAAPWLYSKYIK